VKHKNKRLSPIPETFENPDEAKLKSSSGTTNQSKSKIDISYSFPDHSMDRMFDKLSVNVQRKQKEEKRAVNGSKGTRNKMNSVPLVSDDVSNILQNNSSEFEGIGPSADEVQEPLHENTIRKEDVEHVGDGSVQNSAAKRALDCGNIMTWGGMQTKKNNSASSANVSNILQNNSSEFEGIDISGPSADEVQEPLHENTIRKEDVEHVGDGSVQNSSAKRALDCGNIMTRSRMQTKKNNSARSSIGRVNKNHTKDLKNAVDEGESDAKEQSTSGKKIFIVSPESLSFGRSRSGKSGTQYASLSLSLLY
jgi:GrpB-like predicted nucleotidyltransferase (UPF0157 family)